MSRNTLSGLLAAPLLLLVGLCEHVFWIRSYVLATHAGDEAQGKVAEAEVITNAKALAETIKSSTADST